MYRGYNGDLLLKFFLCIHLISYADFHLVSFRDPAVLDVSVHEVLPRIFKESGSPV